MNCTPPFYLNKKPTFWDNRYVDVKIVTLNSWISKHLVVALKNYVCKTKYEFSKCH